MATIESELIDKLGGTKAVAERFGIREPSVTQWRTRGIPPARREAIAEAFPDMVPPDWLTPNRRGV